MAIDYVNKILVGFIEDDIKFKEIIQEENYYVSDIVDYSLFTNRPNQKIIKTSNFNIKKIMSELFGKDNIPSIGKRKINNNIINIDNEEYILLELGNQYIQEIINNNDTILRAYSNCYYWINNSLYSKESRNLGYNSTLQTQIVYIIKAKIIDFIQNNKNNKKFEKLKESFYDKKNFFKSSINKFRKTNVNTDGKIELLVLSYLFPIPIVVYDNYSKVKNLYLQGEISLTEKNMHLIALKLRSDVADLTTKEGYSWLRDNLLSDQVEVLQAHKNYSEDKNQDKFTLIKSGAVITKGDLYNYFNKLINED